MRQFPQSILTFISEQQQNLPREPISPSRMTFLSIWNIILANLKWFINITASTMEPEITEIEQLYNRIPQQIIAAVSTLLEQYELPHPQLELSSDLDEEELNHMIRMLMGVENLPRFEFIVEGYILRGKLKSHILRYELSPEQTINIQYIIAFPQLQHQQNAKTDEWISSLATLEGPEGALAVAASLYDGSVELYSPSLQKMGSFVSDQDPLKSCTFLPSEQENHYYCLSGGLGEVLQVHLVNLASKGMKSQHISSNSHVGSINSIGVSPGSDMHVATGGSEGELNIWQIPSDFSAVGAHNLKSSKKKVALNLNVLPQLAASTIHKGTIESINWINNQEIVSSSSSHEIAVTDIVKLTRTETIFTRDSVVTSLDTHGSQILSAHEDGQMRMWDRRDPARPTSTYKAHSKWTSCVRFGSSSNTFASGSYDHTVKIWDSRCSFPMQNLHSQEEKVLGIQWLDQKRVVSGGSDSSLHLYAAS